MTPTDPPFESARHIAPAPAAGRATETVPETVSPKIHASHLERLAIVYVRQSSPHQVIENRESTARQYALVDRATQLGWPRERVLVIDDDQGRSGTRADNREGFQRLLVEVNLDHVGIILNLEMSRLARSNKDWHHLLEVCAIFQSVLADSDGVYDPNDPNDRMLLGLKGMVSEIESHTLRTRLSQGRMNKARRAELFTLAPIGYVRVPNDELAFDPDQQVQAVVRLLFEKFEELGSAAAVLKHFVRNGIQLGVRRVNGRVPGPVEWRRPSYSTFFQILHNPTYAGAYSQGRRTSDYRQRTGASRPRRLFKPIEEWDVLLKGVLPAYIKWDQFIANQKTLASNHSRMSSLGSARNGNALLPGLLICGFCGARMVVAYKKQSVIRYSCIRQCAQHAGKQCQHLKGNPIEELVAENVLTVLEPAAIELSLQAADDVQHNRDQLHQNWQQRIERARYLADRAHRQFDAVEPENRLVVRELEQRWDTALREARNLEEDYDRFCLEQPTQLSPQEKEGIRSLSSVVRKIWDAPDTSPADRKEIVRQLVERVVVRRDGDSADLTIHWAGGYVSEHQLSQSVGSFDRLRDFDRFKQRVLELHVAGHSYPQICRQLEKDGFHSPTGLSSFRPSNIRNFLHKYCREELGTYKGAYRQFVGPDEWLVGELSKALGIPQATLQYWQRKGWVHARQLRPDAGRWVFWADTDELKRLRRLRAHPLNHNRNAAPYPAELMTPKDRDTAQ